MPNTNFVPNWTFERTLPSPFDSYSGKSAVMKDIASKYCNQPVSYTHLTLPTT